MRQCQLIDSATTRSHWWTLLMLVSHCTVLYPARCQMQDHRSCMKFRLWTIRKHWRLVKAHLTHSGWSQRAAVCIKTKICLFKVDKNLSKSFAWESTLRGAWLDRKTMLASSASTQRRKDDFNDKSTRLSASWLPRCRWSFTRFLWLHRFRSVGCIWLPSIMDIEQVNWACISIRSRLSTLSESIQFASSGLAQICQSKIKDLISARQNWLNDTCH